MHASQTQTREVSPQDTDAVAAVLRAAVSAPDGESTWAHARRLSASAVLISAGVALSALEVEVVTATTAQGSRAHLREGCRVQGSVRSLPNLSHLVVAHEACECTGALRGVIEEIQQLDSCSQNVRERALWLLQSRRISERHRSVLPELAPELIGAPTLVTCVDAATARARLAGAGTGPERVLNEVLCEELTTLAHSGLATHADRHVGEGETSPGGVQVIALQGEVEHSHTRSPSSRVALGQSLLQASVAGEVIRDEHTLLWVGSRHAARAVRGMDRASARGVDLATHGALALHLRSEDPDLSLAGALRLARACTR